MRAGVPVLAVVFGLVACGGRTGLRHDEREGPSSSSSGGGGGEGGEGGAPPTGVVQLALGAQHSCVRTLGGEVYCWGGNGHGQIGVADLPGELSLTPTRVKLPGPASAVAAGTYTTCAILMDGKLLCWGRNGDAEMGSGVGPDAKLPVEVPMPTADRVDRVALGEAHACAITAPETSPLGTVWCWGRNASGQVGVGGTGVPVEAPTLTRTDVVDVALGAFHSNAVVFGQAPDPFVAGWGTNDAKQTGVDGPSIVDTPTLATPAQVGARVRSGRGAHSCALMGGPTVCWGSNTSGQLGRGIVSESALPDLVVTAIGFDDLALGYSHTCGLSAGAVFCWGLNSSGQLGDGTTALTAMVHPVPNLSGVQAIAAGTLHTCAFLSEKDIRCWGGNDFGQLGDGTTVGKLQPVSIQLP